MIHRAKLQEEVAKNEESKPVQTLEQRTAFRHRVQKFRELQAVYTPQVVVLLAQDPAARLEVLQVESILLGLPSQISTRHRSTACSPDILAIETRLRDAQCRDALHELRTQLHIQDRLYKLKKLHIRNQGPNTRMQTEIKGQDSRVRHAAAKYRRARRAKLALMGPGPWELEFQALNDNDIRGVQDDDPDELAARQRGRKKPGPSEGHRQVSWIWKSADVRGAGYSDSVRVEWVKFRARVQRWMEERRLLPEEMRRILAWLIYEENRWLSRIGQRDDVDDALQEGLTAYAHKQANIRRNMRGTCRQIWYKLMQESGLEMGEEWREVPGYIPRKVRRRVNNKIIIEEEEVEEGETEEVVEGEDGLVLDGLEGKDMDEYRRLVELDQAGLQES